MERHKSIERSIIKTYRKELWRPFMKAVTDYDLIKENDIIMVCMSGGKDSFLMAKLLEELSIHGKFKFELKYVVMDPGYDEQTLLKIEENARILNLNIEIFKTDIFPVVKKIAAESPCYMCARMRRGYLYDKATEFGCNKIALGHHFDDCIETTLLSMLYGAEIKTMVPKVKSSNFKGLELIRPMFLIREDNIIRWTKYNSLEFTGCACDFTKSKEYENSKRLEIKNLIKKLSKIDENIPHNIFKSMENVNLECILGFKYKDNNKDFKDIFEERIM